MTVDAIEILLIEDNPGDAYVIQEHLAGARDCHFNLIHATNLGDGLRLVQQRRFDAILLDLSLPDSEGMATLSAVNAAAGQLPIIVLTGHDDAGVGLEAVRGGAQDYLVKGKTGEELLTKSIHYAIERKQAKRTLQKAHDELEHKVNVRTADLTIIVDELEAEVRQRLATEAELNRSNQLLRMLSDCNLALVRFDDEQAMMQEICRIILEFGSYRMVWVGLAEEDEARTVRPVASLGIEQGYLQQVRISWGDNELGRGPTGAAIRTGEVRFGRDFMTAPELSPWREMAIRRGFRSSIALPLVSEGRAFGALTIYADRPDAFDEKQVTVLREMSYDLSVGITALRTRKLLRERSQQLRELASELTLAEQRERRRLAEVLHDHLQQLLVAAKFRMQIILRTKDKDARQEARAVDDLISQCTEVSRSLTGELSPPILHEGGLVPALEWLVLWMQEKHGLRIDLQADESASPSAEDLTILLFQSVRELLLNVVKHSKVKTACVAVNRRNEQIEVVVSDNGAGFDHTKLRLEGGTAGGFGLFSIRERLELLGGTMTIHSAPRQGSRFTLRAPAPQAGKKVGGGAAGSATITKTGAAEDRGRPGGDGNVPEKIRVLLADDHLIVRQGLAQLLKAEPDMIIVGEASDGRTAVELARQLRPDVVVMDISMPGLNGIEATRIVHAELPELRVIGLSMFEEAERGNAMRAAGAAAYLNKSDAPESLVAAIRDVLEG